MARDGTAVIRASDRVGQRGGGPAENLGLPRQRPQEPGRGSSCRSGGPAGTHRDRPRAHGSGGRRGGKGDARRGLMEDVAIPPVLAHPAVTHVELAGSRARGTHAERSDWDFAVTTRRLRRCRARHARAGGGARAARRAVGAGRALPRLPGAAARAGQGRVPVPRRAAGAGPPLVPRPDTHRRDRQPLLGLDLVDRHEGERSGATTSSPSTSRSCARTCCARSAPG